MRRRATVRLDRGDRRAIEMVAEVDGRAAGPSWHFQAVEGSLQWDALLAVASRLHVDVEVSVEFSREDAAAADWCLMTGSSTSGYPQPEDRYREITYDPAEGCGTCGCGRRQQAPFRMRSTPRWGRRSITQLGWVPDVWFVTPAAYHEVFAPFGIGSREVLLGGGSVLTNVVQLVVEELADVDEFRTAGEPCPTCGVFKLHSRLRDFAPAPVSAVEGFIAQTSGWYGSGGRAFRETVVRGELVAAMTAAGLRGADLRPCVPRFETGSWLAPEPSS